jgi:hypothetical protein
MNKEENLLKEYVSLLISEERGKSHIGAAGSDVGGAVKNVGNIATGLVKKLFSRAKTILKLSSEVVATTLMPWAKPKFDKIMSDGAAEINALKSKYPSPSLWETVPPDLRALAFFLNPTATVFAKGADIITGGSGKSKKSSGKSSGGYGVGMGGGDYYGGDYSINSSFSRQGIVLFEEKKRQEGLILTLKKIRTNTLNDIENLYREAVERDGENSKSAKSLKKLYKALKGNTVNNLNPKNKI